MSNRRWYLVYTKPRQEATARTNLERQGFETYLPLARMLRRRRGQRLGVVAPLFPRYLFVHLDCDRDDWGPIRSTLGVASLVRFGQAPARAPDGLIAFLRAHEDADGVHALAAELYRPGERVRVTEGSLMGYEGVFLARSGRDRVVVLLEIMGREARTVLAADYLEPAARH